MRRLMNSEELEALYSAVGKCIWNIQYLEDVLHTYLAMKVDLHGQAPLSEDKAYEILSKHRRANLGTALGTAERNNVLPTALLADLRTLKEERDWLVHRSMHQDGEKLYTDEGRTMVFRRLEGLMLNSISLKKGLMLEVDKFCESRGISPAKAAALAEKQLKRRRGEA